MSAEHFVRVEFDGRNAATWLVFVCESASDAPCRMVCPKSCESCSHPRTEQVSYCNDGEFISNGGEGAISQAERQDPILLPADTSWTGDTYVWKVRPVRDEATVKAEAIREAATAQRALATDSRTSNGRAEHTDRADWLDDYANQIDPNRLEGAHP